MLYSLDEESARLLSETPDGVLLGVLFRDTGVVRLFPTPDQAARFTRIYRTHREIAAMTRIDFEGSVGFSICLQAGRLRWFSAISVLNDELPDHVLDAETTESILLAIEVERHSDFRCFPER